MSAASEPQNKVGEVFGWLSGVTTQSMWDCVLGSPGSQLRLVLWCHGLVHPGLCPRQPGIAGCLVSWPNPSRIVA